MEGKSLDDFLPNTTGTTNVLNACKRTGSVQRVIMTSQHVRRPGSGLPKSDTDYVPYMLYGESKVMTEQLTRAAGLRCVWTIIRPTAVWGPGHLALADGLWRMIENGRYFHPAKTPSFAPSATSRMLRGKSSASWRPIRLWCREKFITWPMEISARRNGLMHSQKNLRAGRRARFPVSWLRTLSILGDGLRAVGLRFPMCGSRFYNLTTSNAVPVEPVLKLFGAPPYPLEKGVEETVAWLAARKAFATRGAGQARKSGRMQTFMISPIHLVDNSGAASKLTVRLDQFDKTRGLDRRKPIGLKQQYSSNARFFLSALPGPEIPSNAAG